MAEIVEATTAGMMAGMMAPAPAAVWAVTMATTAREAAVAAASGAILPAAGIARSNAFSAASSGLGTMLIRLQGAVVQHKERQPEEKRQGRRTSAMKLSPKVSTASSSPNSKGGVIAYSMKSR
jgi:hypothetical protein